MRRPQPPSRRAADPSLATDRRHLTTAAYGSAAPLAARQAIYRYQQPPIDFLDWALDQVDWRGDERVLDAGCGNGGYLARLATRLAPGVPRLGLDLSRGMLGDLGAGWDPALPRPLLATGDVQALPFADGAFDVALAMHMLYHVPDIPLALRELRRVLRPGGTLLASTNGPDDKRAIDDLVDAAAGALAGHPVALVASPDVRFNLASGAALLRDAFGTAERRDLRRRLVVPAPGPVVRYVDSTRSFYAPRLPDGLGWEALLAEVERRLAAVIAAEGAFVVPLHGGVFICRSRR